MRVGYPPAVSIDEDVVAMTVPGDPIINLVNGLHARGVDRLTVLVRHSAREFHRDRHDLLNPLTDDGRALARRLGSALPEDFHIRGYASPPERCMETASLAMAGYDARGGSIGRHRAVEGLGVFYALDQARMWKALSSETADSTGSVGGGLAQFVSRWSAGEIGDETMIPAATAAHLLKGLLLGKLRQSTDSAQLDLCVSHDLTIMMLRQQLLGMDPLAHPVEFLDGVALFEESGSVHLVSDTGHEAVL